MKRRIPSVHWATSIAAAGLLFTTTAQAAVIFVDTTEDIVAQDGLCSLREAVTAANTDTAVDTCVAGSGEDWIELAEGTYQLVGPGGDDANLSGDLDVQSTVSLKGVGASRTVLVGSGDDRVLHVLAGGKVTLSGLQVTGGRALEGGGIYNASELNLVDVRVEGNEASHGGGIASFGTLSMNRSQIVDNTARGERGEDGHGSNNIGILGGGGGGGGIGGGLYLHVSNAILIETVISGNVARGGDGGNGSGVERPLAGRGGRIGGGDGTKRAPGLPATGPGGGGGGAGGNTTGNWSGNTGGHGSMGGGRGGNSVNFVTANGGGGGGAGLGGAIFASSGSSIHMNSVVIADNAALGGVGGRRGCSSWGACGTHGQSGVGSGGGIFAQPAGSYSFNLVTSRIFNNHASSDPTCDLIDDSSVAKPAELPGGWCNLTTSTVVSGRLLTRVTEEPAGENCAHGGRRIDVGFDRNDNGSLEAGELGNTSFACYAPGAAPTLIRTVAADAAECPEGGQRYEVGRDDNHDGTLEDAEIDSVQVVCNGLPGEDGQDGQDGFDTLVASSPEPVGPNCAAGGQRLASGRDLDRDGTLDEEEVTSVSYVCHGVDGMTSLVRVSAEPPGAHCAEGGQRVESGGDLDRDGMLSAVEVENTVFVCHGQTGATGAEGQDGRDGADGEDGEDGADGADGHNALLSLTSEPAGPNCATGGHRLDFGPDLDADGQLDAEEIRGTEYLCAGASGADGKTTLVRTETLPAGTPCAFGGQAIIVGVDADRDGILSAAEVQSTTQICHGAPGADGQDGRSSLVVTSEATAAQCPDGGTAISNGVDANGNGTLEAEEVDAIQVVCRETCSISEADGAPTMVCTDGSSAKLSGGGCAAGPGLAPGLWLLGLVAVPFLRRRRRASDGA